MAEADPDQVELFRNIVTHAYNIEEALKRLDVKEETLDVLRLRIKSCEIVPRLIVNNQLLVFLNSANGDVELAAKKIERYYQLKQATPELFANRDLASAEIQACFDHLYYVGLPITPDNCQVMFHKLRSLDPKDYDFDLALKAYIMRVEADTYKFGPRSGFIMVHDLAGANFWHLFRPTINTIRKGMKFLQEGSPLEVKEIHILNTVWFLDKIMAMVKPFTCSELLEKVHFHPVGMDYGKFFDRFIPKSCMPSDYGGDLDSVEEMHQKQREKIMEMRQYFLNEWKHVNHEYDKYADQFDQWRADGRCTM